MSIVKAKISIIGKRPLLFHRFSMEAIPLGRKALAGVAGNNPDEWKSTVLKTTNNQLYVEGSYIFGSLRDGARHTKQGKGSMQPKLVATLCVMEEEIYIDRYLPEEKDLTQDKTAPVYLDVRSVVNPASRGRNVRYRIAASTGWKAEFTIEFDNTIVFTPVMEAIVRDAGSFAGLGDGRKIGFGRFDLERFEVCDA